MSTLILARGLPGSGKTTWAKEWLAGGLNRGRSNRDDLRVSLFDQHGVLGHTQERFITEVQQATVRAMLERGMDVVVDDTNLRARYSRAWADLAEDCGAYLEVHDGFLEVPLHECIERDRVRATYGGRYVGADVICDMHSRFLASGPLPPVTPSPVRSDPDLCTALYVPDQGLPSAWIVDLDGTLARMNGRRPYEWERVGEDEPVEAVIETVRALNRGRKIILMSGRDAICRPQTKAWLAKHHVPYDELHMRPEGDQRKDSIVKGKLFDAHVRNRYWVRGVLDDRDSVVALWRGVGLPCFQVAPGAF